MNYLNRYMLWFLLLNFVLAFVGVEALAENIAIQRFDLSRNVAPKKSLFRESIEKNLSSNHQVLSEAKFEKAIQIIKIKAAHCITKKCLTGFAKAGIDWLVQISIEVTGEIYQTEFMVIHAKSQQRSEVKTIDCELCTTNEAMTSIAQEIERSIKNIARNNAGAGQSNNQQANMIIDTAPSGAAITIDGKNMGLTPVNVLLPPGKHTIRVIKSGFSSVEKIIQQPSNQAAGIFAMHFTLVKQHAEALESGGASAVGGPDDNMHLVRWVLIGGGVVAAVVGGYLLGLDETPGPDCDKNETQCDNVYDTFVPGFALMLGGAAMAGTAYLLEPKNPDPTAASGKSALQRMSGASQINPPRATVFKLGVAW
jgi:hypothetical protein